MFMMQYTHRLPADYEMRRIRERAAARGPEWDFYPGLFFKAFLVRERGKCGADANAYSSLYLWRDARAPVLFILATQILAFVLLDRILARTTSRSERLLFSIVYWLSPWRLYFSGFLWNPNYLFLAGAIHATTLLGQKGRPSAWRSALHVATIGFAMQLHPSAVWMPIATAS